MSTIVIGAGQTGLAVGRALAERGEEFLILEAEHRIGDVWRKRWRSLRLFTPAQHDALPGHPFPAPRGSFPQGQEFGDYLESCAKGLPLRLDSFVTKVASVDGSWQVTVDTEVLVADNVVIATGANACPAVPAYSSELATDIRQLHSFDYHDPSDMPEGDVLVVGAGTSGVQLAIELARTHRVFLAGRPTVHIPDAVLRYLGGLYWAFIYRVLTRRTPIGRKVASLYGSRGAPLINTSIKDAAAVGVEAVPRLAGATAGLPLLEDGRVLHVAGVLWATGYRPALDWLPPLEVDSRGWPVTDRGVVSRMPGLYFVGLPYQYGLTSELIGGAGRDAAYVAAHIAAHPSPRVIPSPARG